jgi:hypothetical protein
MEPKEEYRSVDPPLITLHGLRGRLQDFYASVKADVNAQLQLEKASPGQCDH